LSTAFLVEFVYLQFVRGICSKIDH